MRPRSRQQVLCARSNRAMSLAHGHSEWPQASAWGGGNRAQGDEASGSACTECFVCYVEKPAASYVRFKPCAHEACLECVQRLRANNIFKVRALSTMLSGPALPNGVGLWSLAGEAQALWPHYGASDRSLRVCRPIKESSVPSAGPSSTASNQWTLGAYPSPCTRPPRSLRPAPQQT